MFKNIEEKMKNFNKELETLKWNFWDKILIIESYNPIQLKVKQHISKDERIIHEENFQKEKGNKGMKNTRERVRDIEDTMRRSNMNLIKVPKGEEMENRIKAEVV